MEVHYAFQRGLSQAAAQRYIGVSAREFSANWKPHLAAVRAGTRQLFDRIQIDALFESRLVKPVLTLAVTRQADQAQFDLSTTLRACRKAGRQRTARDETPGVVL